MPFAGYTDFAACVAANSDKADPQAYCGTIKHAVEKAEVVDLLKSAVAKRDFSTQQRDKLATSGKALPGGGYPIVTTSDLHNAIQAFGRAKDPEATKRHIISRAKALGATAMLPAGWA